jgi:hypothetical protein
MSTACHSFQPHFRNANVPQKGSGNMLSTCNRPGTLPDQALFLADAQKTSAHLAGQGARNILSGRQFLNRSSTSIPMPMWLISKERFAPNTGESAFYLSTGVFGALGRSTRNPSTPRRHIPSRKDLSFQLQQNQYTPGYNAHSKGAISAECWRIAFYISEKEATSPPAQNIQPNPEICR